MEPKRRKRTRSIGSMRIDKVVGSGTFGIVYKATDKADNEQVALKKIKMERETQGFPVTAIREIKLLNLLKSHKNIVFLKDIVTYNGEENDEEPTVLDKGFNVGDIFMVFEFVDYDLSGLLKSSGLVLTEMHIKSYMHQLLSGVKHLHENKVLHRDIKSANLLITSNHVLKIADWGLARSVLTSAQKYTNPVVTLWYRSPELILGSRHYSYEVDMWSVGCIFGEMKTRVAMFRGDTEATQLDLIFQLTGSPTGTLLDEYKTLPDWEKINFTKNYTSRMNSKYHVMGKKSLNLLEKMLDLNPKTRISAELALEDEYFTSDVIPLPENLPKFNVEPVTEWMEQERQRKERELAIAAQQQQQLAQQQQHNNNSNMIVMDANKVSEQFVSHPAMGVGGGGRGGGRGGGGHHPHHPHHHHHKFRKGAENLTKYTVIKPNPHQQQQQNQNITENHNNNSTVPVENNLKTSSKPATLTKQDSKDGVTNKSLETTTNVSAVTAAIVTEPAPPTKSFQEVKSNNEKLFDNNKNIFKKAFNEMGTKSNSFKGGNITAAMDTVIGDGSNNVTSDSVVMNAASSNMNNSGGALLSPTNFERRPRSNSTNSTGGGGNSGMKQQHHQQQQQQQAMKNLNVIGENNGTSIAQVSSSKNNEHANNNANNNKSISSSNGNNNNDGTTKEYKWGELK